MNKTAWKTGFSLRCKTQRKRENKKKKKVDERKCQKNALVRVVMADGERFEQGG